MTLVDINQTALDFAQVNARAAGVEVETLRQESVPEGAELVIANPPYMMDSGKRAYRDGGDLLGGEVALRWVREALDGMARGGTMLLYTGVPYANGWSPFIKALEHLCSEAGASLTVEELDPDVFGEELEQPAYAEVERIAAIGAVVRRGR